MTAQSPKQAKAEFFEFELCECCGRDAEYHTAIPMTLGAYGGPYWFFRCDKEAAP